LQVNTRTGDFAGVIQHIGGGAVVPASRCIHFVNDQEFDGLYGVARTKAAIPYIELAKSIYDDMALYSRRFAVPYRKGRYKPGFYVAGEDENGDEIRGENGDLLNSYLSGMESGQDVALPSEFHESGNPYWDIEFLQASGEDSYIEKLTHVNDMIRMAVVVPEMASSSSPDTGTYNLGETQIDLFLENIEAYLDQCKEVIDAQLLRDFVFYNFGPGSPPLTIVFEPINAKVKSQLLNGLIAMLTQGVPISDADGNEMNVDWPKLAQDNGVPVSMAPVRSIADQLRSAAEQRMAELSEVRLMQSRRTNGQFGPGSGSGAENTDAEEPTQYDRAAVRDHLEKNASLFRHIEPTRLAWDEDFGPSKTVATPVGDVKIGENQFDKLLAKGRLEYAGLVKPTLQDPLVVFEVPDEREGVERKSVQVFIKPFAKESGLLTFAGISVSKDGLEVMISAHGLDDSKVLKMMKAGKVLFKATAFRFSDSQLPSISPSRVGVSLHDFILQQFSSQDTIK
jgi:hypothetical protein